MNSIVYYGTVLDIIVLISGWTMQVPREGGGAGGAGAGPGALHPPGAAARHPQPGQQHRPHQEPALLGGSHHHHTKGLFIYDITRFVGL